MKVLITFPPIINNSDYLMHLMEHCIVISIYNSKETFFSFYDIISGYKTGCSITLDFGYFDDIEKIKNIIQSLKLNKQCINTEKGSIRQEYSGNARDEFRKIVDKIGKTIYGNKFSFNRTQKVNFKTISDYFNTYVTLDNCIILNNHNNIVFRGTNIGLNSLSFTDQSKICAWECEKIRLNDGYHIVSKKKFTSIKDLRVVEFLEYMFNAYGYGFHRLLHGTYFVPQAHCYHFPDYSLIFGYEKFIKDALEKLKDVDWFEQGKKGFLYNLQYGIYKICFADFLILYGIESDIESVSILIQSLQIEEILLMFGILGTQSVADDSSKINTSSLST